MKLKDMLKFSARAPKGRPSPDHTNAFELARMANKMIDDANENGRPEAAARAQNSKLGQAARQRELAIQHQHFHRLPEILAAATKGVATGKD